MRDVTSASGAHWRERPKRCNGRSVGRLFVLRERLLTTAHIVQARHLQYLQCLCERSALQLEWHGSGGEHVRLAETESSSPRTTATQSRTARRAILGSVDNPTLVLGEW